MSTIWAAAYAAINIFAFFLCFYDKQCAKHNRMRVPERVLWLFAIIFGALGTYVGMRIFHHKTRKPSFAIGVPFLLIAQVFIFMWLGIFQ